ncbi:hypothetical protein [Thalassovita taeanensis]|uniref:Uncharacterized protein n=1 Tax=Thalassovita taeanensis TaxID=657014 RepID=A0A1H9FCW2_9RHOB|nr:hypothetical protein [Thalassovita taeanensis]SEQ35747.1 hypothetical protein SAMN04488092_10643 [Thalassovita taeanensis]
MSDQTETKFWTWNNPILWGIAATFLIVGLGVVLGWVDTCSTSVTGVETCRSKWAAFVNAAPNEVGDTLAGFAGALAFVWIIATVWLQSHELRAQREELRLTRDEMMEQRKATQDMARSMAAQAAIFEDEKRQRFEDRASALLTEKIHSFLDFVKTHNFPSWDYFEKRAGSNGTRGVEHLVEIPFRSSGGEADFQFVTVRIVRNGEVIRRRKEEGQITEMPKFDEDLEVLKRWLMQILAIGSDLSEADVEKLRRYQVEEAANTISDFCAAEYWAKGSQK